MKPGGHSKKIEILEILTKQKSETSGYQSTILIIIVIGSVIFSNKLTTSGIMKID
jgi:hypothetical protein